VPPWLKEAGLCEALTRRRRTPIQMQSATYAAVRSGSGVLLRITADTASSAVCGAPHTGEFERTLIITRTSDGRLAAKARGVAFGRPKKMRPDRQELARELVRDGKSISTVARTFNVHPTTIHSVLEG
jgi:hypothetical protein